MSKVGSRPDSSKILSAEVCTYTKHKLFLLILSRKNDVFMKPNTLDVVSYRDQKIWKFSSNVVCASLVVQLVPGGNEQNTINQITQYFKGRFQSLIKLVSPSY